MQLQSVTCNSCGAAIDVAETTNFATCGECGTRLAVVRTESSLFTERVQTGESRIDELELQLARSAYDRELQRIDLEWDREEMRYRLRDRSFFGTRGPRVSPDKCVSAALAFVFIAIGMTFVALDIYHGRDGFMIAIGLLMIVWALGYATITWSRCNQYDAAYERYLRRRNAAKIEDYFPTKTTPIM